MSEKVREIPSSWNKDSTYESLRAQLAAAGEELAWEMNARMDAEKRERKAVADRNAFYDALDMMTEKRNALDEKLFVCETSLTAAEERARVAEEKVSVLAQKTGKLERLIEDLQTYRYPDVRTFISQWKDNHQ